MKNLIKPLEIDFLSDVQSFENKLMKDLRQFTFDYNIKYNLPDDFKKPFQIFNPEIDDLIDLLIAVRNNSIINELI